MKMPACKEDWPELDDWNHTPPSLLDVLGEGNATPGWSFPETVGMSPPPPQMTMGMGLEQHERKKKNDEMAMAMGGGGGGGGMTTIAMLMRTASSTESEGGGLKTTSSSEDHSVVSCSAPTKCPPPAARKRKMSVESRARRQANNKRAAARYREKRKVYVHGLETKVKSLSKALEQKEKEFDRLQTSNSVLTEQLQFLKNLIGDNAGAKAGAALQMAVCLAGLMCVFLCTLPEQGTLAGCYPPSRGLLSVNTQQHDTTPTPGSVGGTFSAPNLPHHHFYNPTHTSNPPNDVCVRPAPSWAQPAWDLGGSPGCFGGSAVVSTLRVLAHAVVMIIWINVCAYYLSISGFRAHKANSSGGGHDDKTNDNRNAEPNHTKQPPQEEKGAACGSRRRRSISNGRSEGQSGEEKASSPRVSATVAKVQKNR